MSDLTKYCCDVCGDEEVSLLTLSDRYSSNAVNKACEPCVRVMEDFQKNVRALMTEQEHALIKLFMRKKKRDNFKISRAI